MANTTNLNLVITPASDTTKKFLDWRNELSGDQGSNMQKIDDAFGALQDTVDGKINQTQKGSANGLAELDENGKVPSSQLPSYVDDVLEGTYATFPATGEAGKIYVDTNTNITYRWSGTAYVAIGSDLALGETASTAYRGDRGKIAYNHSQAPHAPCTNATSSASGLMSNVDKAKLDEISTKVLEWDAANSLTIYEVTD